MRTTLLQTMRKSLMKQFTRCTLLLSIALFGSVWANEESVEGAFKRKSDNHCCTGLTGLRGPVGPTGTTGPNFGQYASLYTNTTQSFTSGDNVLFESQVSLAGISYNNATGVFTLSPGVYAVTYFVGGGTTDFNVVANGSVVRNSPLGAGFVGVIPLSNATNTLSLTAQTTTSFSSQSAPNCAALITIYQID